MGNLGTVVREEGDYVTAITNLDQMLTLAKQLGSRSGEGAALNGLGTVAENQKNFAIAHTYYKEALKIVRQIGDRQNEAICLRNLGRIAPNEETITQPRPSFSRLLHFLGSKVAALSKLLSWATWGTQRSIKETAVALGYYWQALTVNQQVGHQLKPTTLSNLGKSDVSSGGLCSIQDLP